MHSPCLNRLIDRLLGRVPAQHYVVGFAFDTPLRNVVLIRKTHPEWQAGLYNGVGGKVESNDLEYDEGTSHAMAREFWEETGLHTSRSQWKEFATQSYKAAGTVVHYFFLVTDDVWKLNPDRVQLEPVMLMSLDLQVTQVPDLHYLIPMALAAIKDPLHAHITFK